jgi:hypothetical protein
VLQHRVESHGLNCERSAWAGDVMVTSHISPLSLLSSYPSGVMIPTVLADVLGGSSRNDGDFDFDRSWLCR